MLDEGVADRFSIVRKLDQLIQEHTAVGIKVYNLDNVFKCREQKSKLGCLICCALKICMFLIL